jgi:hypothetical protein
MASKKAKRKRPASNGGMTGPATKPRVSAEDLPRKTLEEAIKLADAIHSSFAGQATPWNDLANALGIGGQTNATKYLFWSAVAYGVVNKEEGNSFSLAEIGRKILAPLYEGEDREGKIKALLTPNVLSKFYTDYNGHPLPSDEIFPNVLERKYGVPRERVTEAQSLILANGEYAGIIKTQGEKRTVVLGTDAAVPAASGPPDEIEPTDVTDTPADAEWEKICFYITPIGDDGTDIRKHSDMMLKHLVEPILSQAGMKVIRADKIEKSGLISQQIFEHVARSRLCIADLSFNNPNAFYELGVRHICMLPTIQVIRKGDKIPFDVSQGRTIVVDTSDVYTIMDKFESARKELAEHVKHSQQNKSDSAGEDNPVSTYLPGLRVTIPKQKAG